MKIFQHHKWYLFFLISLGGLLIWLYFQEDTISLAKESLKTKGFYVRSASRSNPIDRTVLAAKRFLKRDELRIARIKWYTETESLAGIEELQTLAPFIVHLNCGLSKIHDSDAYVIGKMHDLRSLILYGPDLSDRGVLSLSRLERLESLELYAPKSTDAGLNWLHRCPHLHRLILGDAKLGTPTVQQLSQHYELRRLNLQGTLITSSDLQFLTDLPQLWMLELTRDFIDDSAAPHLRKMNSLGNLQLNETEVGDEVCSALSKLPDLSTLNLNDTQITDRGVCILLEGCLNLKSLSVARCDLTDKAFVDAKTLPVNLKTITITGNRITGQEIMNIYRRHPVIESINFNQSNYDPDIVDQIEQIRKTRSK
ncbi:MAG: hypothetical protein KDA70_05065 [Planctomycetaceae bacterium]|nr:hypothetical protein [Planctomycetaceae bacterium]